MDDSLDGVDRWMSGGVDEEDGWVVELMEWMGGRGDEVDGWWSG